MQTAVDGCVSAERPRAGTETGEGIESARESSGAPAAAARNAGGCDTGRCARQYYAGRRESGPPMIALHRLHDMIEATDIPDSNEAADATEPTDKIEPAEPTEPTDNTDPTDPIERIEPREPMLSSESVDLIDQREPSVSLMGGS